MSEETVGLAALLFSVVLLAGLCIWITRAAAEGRLPVDGSVGIRTRRTMRSAAAWEAGHAAALPILSRLWWVAGVTVVGAVVLQWQLGGAWGIVAGLTGLAVEVVILMYATYLAGRAADRT